MAFGFLVIRRRSACDSSGARLLDAGFYQEDGPPRERRRRDRRVRSTYSSTRLRYSPDCVTARGSSGAKTRRRSSNSGALDGSTAQNETVSAAQMKLFGILHSPAWLQLSRIPSNQP